MAAVQPSSATRPITPSQGAVLSKQLYLSPSRIASNLQPPSTNLALLSPVSQNGSFAFHRVIKSGKVNRRIKKKGAFKASWKPAYLVLRPNLLSIYKDDKESELKLSITLSDVTAVTPVKKSHTSHVFGIFSPTKNYHFAGLTARDATDWITALRLETRTDDQDILEPPSVGPRQDQPGYDTTDLSGEELDLPGSPDGSRRPYKGIKPHMNSQTKADFRNLSNQTAYSGNEQLTTSQSDFSDFGSAPHRSSFLSTSIPLPNTPLSPIPDNMATNPVRPPFARGLSNLSDTNVPLAQNPTRTQPYSQLTDPSKVIRQGYLKISKTTSGVRQWRNCWTVLRSDTLSVYKSPSEYSPALILPTYGIVEAAEIERKRENCFQIIGEDKTYRFQAESENELEMWLGALKSVLVKLGSGRKSREASVSLAREQNLGGMGISTLTNQPGQIRERPASRDIAGMMAALREVSIGSNQTPNVHKPGLRLEPPVSTVTSPVTQ